MVVVTIIVVVIFAVVFLVVVVVIRFVVVVGFVLIQRSFCGRPFQIQGHLLHRHVQVGVLYSPWRVNPFLHVISHFEALFRPSVHVT